MLFLQQAWPDSDGGTWRGLFASGEVSLVSMILLSARKRGSSEKVVKWILLLCGSREGAGGRNWLGRSGPSTHLCLNRHALSSSCDKHYGDQHGRGEHTDDHYREKRG
jgi:hypothetical protein